MRVSKTIRQRVELIANERAIDQAEIAAALASGQRLIDFANMHNLSLDWLAFCDLRGLERQTRWV
jgi:hypothetical protein